jgi:hypothetical protein
MFFIYWFTGLQTCFLAIKNKENIFFFHSSSAFGHDQSDPQSVVLDKVGSFPQVMKMAIRIPTTSPLLYSFHIHHWTLGRRARVGYATCCVFPASDVKNTNPPRKKVGEHGYADIG